MKFTPRCLFTPRCFGRAVISDTLNMLFDLYDSLVISKFGKVSSYFISVLRHVFAALNCNRCFKVIREFPKDQEMAIQLERHISIKNSGGHGFEIG